MEKIWSCKIGYADAARLPDGADFPMREGIRYAFRELTGHYPDFIFSGWGAQLDNIEQEIVDRMSARQEEPLLGLATTEQLLAELKARAKVGGYASYRPIDNT